MLKIPQYKITPEIINLISQIEAIKIFLDESKINSKIKDNILRISLFKSSLYSARIEGNPLTEESFDASVDKIKKLEIQNLITATKFTSNIKKINLKAILKIHSLILKNLSPDAGELRHEMGGIFDQSGNPVYISPPPDEIKALLANLIKYINSDREQFSIIKAFISHLYFEKIHPFIDGNGRVGRLLIQTITQYPLPIEEYLDKYKTEYYDSLDNPKNYLLFMLNAYLETLKNQKNEIDKQKNKKIILPPRQEEIYNIIKDHQTVSFDFIKRRFLKVPERTLRYDLKKLQDQNLIIKLGKTRGSYYLISKK